MNNSIPGKTPVSNLTVSQLIDLLGQKNLPDGSAGYGHGLNCIKKLFGVSHATAQRYKNTFLKPAIKQNGRIIIVDIARALELFNEHNK